MCHKIKIAIVIHLNFKRQLQYAELQLYKNLIVKPRFVF